MMKAVDRFGDYGWSGLVVAEIQGETIFIESFLMSCRVMGKNAEYALLSAVAEWAGKKGCSAIRGLFIPTSKNLPCKEFLAKSGLSPCGESMAEAGQMFESKISNLQVRQADHIKISVNL